MTALLLRVALSSVLLALGALAAERALREVGRSGRGVWLVALMASAGVTLLLAAGGSLPLTVPRAMVDAVALSGAQPSGGLEPFAIREPSGWSGLLVTWVVSSTTLLLGLALASVLLERRLGDAVRSRIEGVDVLVTERLGPAVAGLLRPRIVVPAWLHDLSPRQQRLVVRHEAEHAAAGDHALSLAGVALCCIVPWNPFAWYQLHRLRLAIELDCDARVLGAEAGARGDYGRLLIDVAERMARGTPLATALIHPRSFLERRIRMLTQRSKRPIQAVGWALGAMVLVVAACADGDEPTMPDGPDPQELTLEPLASGEFRVTPMDGESATPGQPAGILRPSLRRTPADAVALQRTVGGEAVSRFELRDPANPPAGSRVLRFEMQVDADGRATDVRFEPGTPAELQPRVRESLEPIRFKRSMDAETGDWTPGVVTLP